MGINMAFFIDISRDIAIAQIPRCGIGTIKEWLGQDAIVVPNNDKRLLSITRRVAFIRNPRERIESAFSLFYWSFERRKKLHVSNAPIDSWESFVDHILSSKIDDEHWRPQTDLIGNVPNTYHRFENIAERFEIYRPGILPHNSKTSRRPSTNYRSDELLRKYADDLTLWNEVS